MYDLTLYIVGHTARSQKAIEDLEALLEPDFRDEYSLRIVNLLENQELAESDGILVTPTLIKSSPGPVKKIVGDLSEKQAVLAALGMR